MPLYNVGYKLAKDPCCLSEVNDTEFTCTVNVTAMPSSMVGEERLLAFELESTDYNFVSNKRQMLVFVEHIVAGVWIACTCTPATPA